MVNAWLFIKVCGSEIIIPSGSEIIIPFSEIIIPYSEIIIVESL